MQIVNNHFYKTLLLLSFFSAGFSLYYVFIPLLMISLILSIIKNRTLYAGCTAASYNVLFIVLFVFSVFSIGSELLILESPVKYAMYMIFLIVCLPLLLINNFEYAWYMLFFFILGVFFRAESIVVYSFLDPSGVYGYGKLLDPFNHEEINSPGISNSLAIVFLFFFVAYKNTLSLKCLLIFIYPLILLSSIFLGGRAFFIIVLVCITYKYSRNFKIKTLIGLTTLICLGCFFSLLVKEIPFFDKYFDLIFERFGSEGLKSARFELIQDGITKFLIHPLGGVTPNASEYSGYWYHNIYLDSARVAGVISLIPFILSNLIVLISYLGYRNYRKRIKNPYFFISLITLIIMCQDVVLEGNMMLLISYALFTTMAIQSRRYKKSETLLQSK
ncbi:TPA: hypothetical protein IDX61_004759 [Escherichia coli]|nr:hypothetical protein [Escherichia coli]